MNTKIKMAMQIKLLKTKRKSSNVLLHYSIAIYFLRRHTSGHTV